MAISINEQKYLSELYFLYSRGKNVYQLDPCFPNFKRIKQMYMDDVMDDRLNHFWIENLQMIGKPLVFIDLLKITDNNIVTMNERYKDKHPNFMVDCLELAMNNHANLLNEDIEVINKINPKFIDINGISWSLKNIKALALLSCTNFNVDSDYFVYFSKLLFLNTPIQLFDLNTDQRVCFEWESIIFSIDLYKFEQVKLLKTNTTNYLFIPLNTIGMLTCSGFKSISSEHYFNKQFADIDIKQQTKINGFIIPLKYLDNTFFKFDENSIKLFDSSLEVISQIFKARHIDWEFGNLSTLLDINKLLPDHFSRINFACEFYDPTEITNKTLLKIMNSPLLIRSKFSIMHRYVLLPSDELNLVWKMLLSRRTRFSITSINLKLELLSECLTVLSLCADWPELNSVELWYLEAEEKSEQKIIERAIREFTMISGPIQKLVIAKYYE